MGDDGCESHDLTGSSVSSCLWAGSDCGCESIVTAGRAALKTDCALRGIGWRAWAVGARFGWERMGKLGGSYYWWWWGGDMGGEGRALCTP